MSQQVQASLASTRPNLPVSRITVDGKVLDGVVVVDLVINREINKHDSALISVLWPTTEAPDIERKPISFSYGTGSKTTTFYGYVYATEKSQELQKQTVTKITCLGVTWMLRNVTPRLFVSRTAKEIVEEVVRPHQLGSVVDPSDYKFPRLAQVKSTDWEMLTEVAYVCGMYAVSNDGVVRLIDPIAELEKCLPARRYLKSTTILDPEDISLLDFSATNSVTTNTKHLQPTFGYFGTDDELQTYIPTADAVDIYPISEVYISGTAEGVQRANTMARWNSFNQSAEARVRGDGMVSPGDAVSIKTGMSNSIVDNYDGMWIVRSVEHKIDNKVFQTNLKMGRDKYREPVTSRSRRLFWSNDSRPAPSITVSGGRWTSNWKA